MKSTILWLIVTICAMNLSAQTTTVSVSGAVQDEGGAAVPNASVQITNTDTNAARTVQSGATGAYLLPNLPIGPYRLEVSKEGFARFIQTGIILQVNTNPAINVILHVGAVAQTVEVEANAAMVETQSTGVGQVIQPEQVLDLPLNGRQASQLITLSGAAVNGSSLSGLASDLDYPGTVAIALSGNQPNATNYILDSSPNMDYRDNTGAPMPFPDALTEFRVNSSTVPANDGSRPGGTVNGVTKSGTNAFHGDLFEFLRNGYVNAAPRTFQNPSGTMPPVFPDNLKRSQFGGVIGGPIKRDKVFFFYGLQETRQRQNLAPVVSSVPTAASLKGDFTGIDSPACNGGTQRHLASIVQANGSIPAQQLTASDNVLAPAWLNSPAAQMSAQMAKLLPTPDDPVCGLITTSQYQPNNETQHVARVDWQHSSKHSLYGRYFIAGFSQPSSYNPDSPYKMLTLREDTLADRMQNVSIGDTYIVSANMANNFRMYFGRYAIRRTSDPRLPNICTIGSAYSANFACMDPVRQLTVFKTKSPGSTGWTYENNYGITNNLSWLIGAHHLEIGGIAERVDMNAWGTFNTDPQLTYNTGSVISSSSAAACAPAAAPCFLVSSTSASTWTGIALADFLTGNLSTYSQGHGQLAREQQWMPSAYVQDNWKVNHKLELTAGARWDPFLAPKSLYGYATDFSMASFLSNKISTVYPNAPPGVTFPGDAGFSGKAGVASHLADFSPRAGFVIDPSGRGQMTIRGGYGLFWDTAVLWNANDISQNQPFGGTITITPPPVYLANPSQGGGLTNVFLGYPGGDPFPKALNPGSSYKFPQPSVVGVAPVSTGTNFTFWDAHLKPTYVQEWSLSWQWQVRPNWLVSSSYMGNKTTHGWISLPQNPDVFVLPTMTSSQYPGIVNASGVSANGATGACTLLYAGQPVTLNPCNASSNASTSARRLLSMLNPSVNGGGMFGGASSGNQDVQGVGAGSYNGLLVSVEHRLSHGFSLLSNFTWSHCLDEVTIGQDVSGGLQNPLNPRSNWSNCDFDRRKVVNTSIVGQTPKFSSRWRERLMGNWTGSGIFTASTGAPFTVTPASTNYTLNGVSSDRPNVYGNPFTGGSVSANPTLTSTQQAACPTTVHTWQNWFNPCAYGNNTTPGQYGNESRNSIVGPGSWDMDAAVWRTFPIRERYKVDFRLEGFNVFNHPSLASPSTVSNNSLSSATPGRITSTSSTQRQFQAAVKINF